MRTGLPMLTREHLLRDERIHHDGVVRKKEEDEHICCTEKMFLALKKSLKDCSKLPVFHFSPNLWTLDDV